MNLVMPLAPFLGDAFGDDGNECGMALDWSDEER